MAGKETLVTPAQPTVTGPKMDGMAEWRMMAPMMVNIMANWWLIFVNYSLITSNYKN